jgi:O-antigen ligase
MQKLTLGALCLFMFSIPLEDTVAIPGVGSTAFVLGFIAIIAGIFCIGVRATFRMPDFAHIMWSVFFLFAVVSLAWTYDPASTMRSAYLYAAFLVTMLLLWEIVQDSGDLIPLMKWMVYGAAIGAIWTLYSYLHGNTYRSSEGARYSAGDVNPNGLALTFALNIVLAWYLGWKSTSRLGRVGFRSLIPLLIFATLLTASRAGTMALLAGLLIIPALQRGKSLALTSLLAIGVVIAVMAVAPAENIDRIFTIRDEVLTGTMGERTLIWASGWNRFLQSPVLGVGAGAFASAVSQMKNDPGIVATEGGSFGLSAAVAHNTFLGILVDLGAVGLFLFLCGLSITCLRIVHMPSAEKKLWSIMLLVWCVGANAGTLEIHKITWILFGMIIVQAGAFRNLRRTNAEAGMASTVLGRV